MVAKWSLGAFGTESALSLMWGWCLSLRDLAWAWWPLPLHFLCLGQWSQSFLLLLFCLFGLLYFGQESVRVFFWWNLSWACCALSCCQSSSGSPSYMLVCQLPPCWVDSWCHSEPLVPSGEKIFNATHGHAFAMVDPAGTAGPSHLRVVCWGGITG